MRSSRPSAKLGTQREPLPYFAGRGGELAALGERLDRLCETGDPSGGMSLIVGVPGVGKTHLGMKFAEEATQRSDVCRVSRTKLNTQTLKAQDVVVFMSLMTALDSEKIGRQVADIDDKTTAFGAGIAGVNAKVIRDRVRDSNDLTTLLQRSHQAGAWNGKALLVTIDELQRVSHEGIETLCALHEGDHGCPILIVGIGLQHTPQVLGNPGKTVGISRLAQTIKLAPLPPSEALLAIEQNLLALVGHKVPKPCAEALATASHGFPQHIHGYLAGAVDAIAKHGHLDEGSSSLADAIAAGDRARVDYYNARLNMLSDQDAMLAVVNAMRERHRDSLRMREAVEALDDESYDGAATVREAVAHGVLTTDDEGALSFGIPSFHNHMLQRLDADRQRRQRGEEVNVPVR